MDVTFQREGLPEYLEIVETQLEAFKDAIPECESIGKEGQNYYDKIE